MKKGTQKYGIQSDIVLRIQAVVDGVDAVAVEMEAKRGCGRLRLLVDDDLRMRFDKQRQKFSTAIYDGHLPTVETHAKGMIKGWMLLDKTATENNKTTLNPIIWEARKPNGQVIAVVRNDADAHAVSADKRFVEVWTMDEIARLMGGSWSMIGKAKEVFPGALVVDVLEKDPDDPIPF